MDCGSEVALEQRPGVVREQDEEISAEMLFPHGQGKDPQIETGRGVILAGAERGESIVHL